MAQFNLRRYACWYANPSSDISPAIPLIVGSASFSSTPTIILANKKVRIRGSASLNLSIEDIILKQSTINYCYDVHVNRIIEIESVNKDVCVKDNCDNQFLTIDTNHYTHEYGFGQQIFSFDDNIIYEIEDNAYRYNSSYRTREYGRTISFMKNGFMKDSYYINAVYNERNQTIRMRHAYKHGRFAAISRCVENVGFGSTHSVPIALIIDSRKIIDDELSFTNVYIDLLHYSLNAGGVSDISIFDNSKQNRLYLIAGFKDSNKIYIAEYRSQILTESIIHDLVEMPNDYHSGDPKFGTQVSISTNYFIVGAPGFTSNSYYPDRGRIYVYDKRYMHTPIARVEGDTYLGGHFKFGNYKIVIDENERFFITSAKSWPNSVRQTEGIMFYSLINHSGLGYGTLVGNIPIPASIENEHKKLGFGHSIIFRRELLIVSVPYDGGGELFFYDIKYNATTTDEYNVKHTLLANVKASYFINMENKNITKFGIAMDLTGNTLFVSTTDSDNSANTDFNNIIVSIDLPCFFDKNNIPIHGDYFIE
jgi:hypothetical protein